MADTSLDKTKGKGIESDSRPQKIRFFITSINVQALENSKHYLVTANLVQSAKNENLKTYGPVRHPTKVLRMNVRKSPCGNGTATFDRFEMRIHKRVLTLICPTDFLKKVTDFAIDPGVEVELQLTDYN